MFFLTSPDKYPRLPNRSKNGDSMLKAICLDDVAPPKNPNINMLVVRPGAVCCPEGSNGI